MYCSTCGAEVNTEMRYCKRCGANVIFSTNPLADQPPVIYQPVVKPTLATFFIAVAIIVIVLGGLGIISETVQELMQPPPWAPQSNTNSHIPVAIPFVVFGSLAIFGVSFFLMRLFSQMMGLKQEKPELKNKHGHRMSDYRQAPPQIQAPPIILHNPPPSITEHTTRNFDKAQVRERAAE